jgi:hypothetical protein
MLISVNVPGDLVNVSNGRLQSVKAMKDGTKRIIGTCLIPLIITVSIIILVINPFQKKYNGEKGFFRLQLLCF